LCFVVSADEVAPDKITKPSWMMTLASIAVNIATLYLANGVPSSLDVGGAAQLPARSGVWLAGALVTGSDSGDLADGNPGPHRARNLGLDGSRSDDPCGTQDSRISAQYRGEAQLVE
jgi:hypothetical protein